MVVVILAASVATGNVSLDKTGTSAERLKNQGSQVASMVQLASLSSFPAERGGFEPPVPISQDTAFPVPHNRPLCHLSGEWSSNHFCGPRPRHAKMIWPRRGQASFFFSSFFFFSLGSADFSFLAPPPALAATLGCLPFLGSLFSAAAAAIFSTLRFAASSSRVLIASTALRRLRIVLYAALRCRHLAFLRRSAAEMPPLSRARAQAVRSSLARPNCRE